MWLTFVKILVMTYLLLALALLSVVLLFLIISKISAQQNQNYEQLIKEMLSAQFKENRQELSESLRQNRDELTQGLDRLTQKLG